MDTPRRSIRPEFVLCLILIAFAVLAWLGFIAFIQTTRTERAAFHFLSSHLRLGESPEFVLMIAGDGLPQPLENLRYHPEFWVSLAVLLVFIAALGWLAARLRAAKSARGANP